MVSIRLMFVLALPTIWIVDAANGPGTSFTDLPPAVAAAQSGDTIIVRAGPAYTLFSVSGKPLTIRGDGSTVTYVNLAGSSPASPATTIDSVPAGQTFFVSGIAFSFINWSGAPPPVQLATMKLTGAGSRVVLSNVTVTGPSLTGQGGRGVVVGPGVEVHADGCSFGGGVGGGLTAGSPIPGAFGGAAVLVESASFAARMSDLFGGPGVGGGTAPTGTGGPALQVDGGSASLSRCNVHGGTAQAPLATGAFGGTGLLASHNAFVRVAGSAGYVVGGGSVGVVANAGYAVVSATGATVIVHSPIVLLSGNFGGSISSGPVTMDTRVMPDVVALGLQSDFSGEIEGSQPVTVMVDGVIPSAPFTLGVSLLPSFSTAFAPLALGEVLLSLPAAGLIQGSLDASATWSATGIPSAIPALVGVPIYIQVGVFDATTGQFRLSGSDVVFFRP